MSEPKTLEEIARAWLSSDAGKPAKSITEMSQNMQTSLVVALTEAYELGRAEERVLLADHE